MTERRGSHPPPSRSGATPSHQNARSSRTGRLQTFDDSTRIEIRQQAQYDRNQGASRRIQATSASAQGPFTTSQVTYAASQGSYDRVSGTYPSRPGTRSAGQSDYAARSEPHDAGQGSAAYPNPQLNAFGSQFATSDPKTPCDDDLGDATGPTTSFYPTDPYNDRIGQEVGTATYNQPRGSSQHPWAPPQQSPFVGPSLPPTTNARPSFIPQQAPYYSEGIGRGSNNQEHRNSVLQDPSPIHYDPHRGFNLNVDSVQRQSRRQVPHETPPSADYYPSRSNTFEWDPPAQLQPQLSPYPPSPSQDPDQYGRLSRPLQRKSSTTTSRTYKTTTSFDSRESAPRYHNVPDPLPCEHCSTVTSGLDRITNMKRHAKEKHGDQKVRCPSCGKDFTRSANMRRHRDGKEKSREGNK